MSLAKYAAAFFRMARSSSSCLTFCRSSYNSCSCGVRWPCPRKASAPSERAALIQRDIVHGEMPKLCAASEIVRPCSVTRRTAPSLNSLVNCLRSFIVPPVYRLRRRPRRVLSHCLLFGVRFTDRVERTRRSVCHGQGEWARDDDGDGVREVHTNTIEGLWTTARNFLRPFRGVHKKHLKYYLAMCEHHINLKRVTPRFIAQLVAEHQSVT